MAWNPTAKVYAPVETKRMPLGLPVTATQVFTNNGYIPVSDDILRLMRDAYKKVTWVWRAIDVISGNQALLPMALRKDNDPNGELLPTKSNDVLDLLNRRANVGENAFVFRKRVSQQLLLSRRGVFIEIIRGRGGMPIALNLLPPHLTAPIPHPKTFVSGYEITLPVIGRQVLRPSDVIWIRNPHPIDPYMSETALEVLGVTIDIENLAKMYNRNFLLNDGKPGGLVVLKGEMDEDEKEEVRTRFQGNIGRAGAVTVLTADDGVDYVDLSSSPREASYLEMRNLTKEEILSAFGVPESVLGNASGRTFSNAAEEIRVFWTETMKPHLETLARAFDELDPRNYVDFDTSEVAVLQLAKQEHDRYLLEEYQSGATSGNEYREATGRKRVDSELADALLANPNLTPIGNTEKKMTFPTPAEGGAPQPAVPVGAAGVPVQDPNGPPGAALDTPAEPEPENEASFSDGDDMELKAIEFDTSGWADTVTKADTDGERWQYVLATTLERLYERQQRVVLEKARGAKARTAIAQGTLTAGALFDLRVWNKQTREDIQPVLAGILAEAMTEAGIEGGTEGESFYELLNAHAERVEKANETTFKEIDGALLSAMSLPKGEDRHGLLIAALGATFVALLGKRKTLIAEEESHAAMNSGAFLVAERKSHTVLKTWVTRRDQRVRTAHAHLEGQTRKFHETFFTGGQPIRYPGDPLAPPSLTIGCRCRLRFDALDEVEA